MMPSIDNDASESHQPSDAGGMHESLYNLTKPSAKKIGNTSIVIRPNHGVDLKLFVGQIPKEWDEDMVSKFFSGYGEILESQIMRDTRTGQSKGCAFVKFASMTKAEEAKKLIEARSVTLPGANHPIQIKWADGEDQRLGVDEHTTPKLFVGSIPRHANEANLRDVFSQFGQIEELIIMKDPIEGTSKGSAFVKFKSKEEAIIAVRILNGNVYLEGSDKPMEVRFAEISNKAKKTTTEAPVDQHYKPKNQWTPAPITPVIPVQTSTVPFHKYMTADGTPYYYNPYTRQTQWEEPPPGTMVYPEPPEQPYVVKSPLANMPKRPGPSGCNLFVFYLPSEWTDEILYSYFKDFGSVISCRVMKDRQTNRSKGFGFISYDNPTSAQMAIQKMNGFQAGAKRIKVEIKKGNDEEPTSNMTSAMKFTPY